MSNNFSADSNCVALWRMESGALTTDSKGTNTLTNNNTVTEDTVNYKEGSCSADFELNNSESLTIIDANLNAGFPLKSGNTNKIISVCLWFRLESLVAGSTFYSLFTKHDPIINNRSLSLGLDDAETLLVYLGYNGGASYVQIDHASVLSTATWYHVTFTYENTGTTYALRLKDTNGNTVGTDVTGSFSQDINVAAQPVVIGACYINTALDRFFDGLIDEVVVFKDVITAAEATQIAQGIYGAAGGGSAALTGTATETINESNIVAGGKTIIITLTGDTFIA